MPYIDKEIARTLEQARQAFSQSDYRSASTLADNVLQKDPKHPEACYIVGAAAKMDTDKDIEDGIKALEKALK